MNLTRRSLMGLSGLLGAELSACARRRSKKERDEPREQPQDANPPEPTVDLDEFEDLALDMAAWSYDEANDCYYQLMVPYCLTPGSEQYESLSIFVPGAYLQGTKKGRSYVCTVDEQAQVGAFTPRTAPIAMPINSISCSAQECPSSYSYEGLGRYLEAGIVYVYAGFRGRSGGYESTTQEYFSGGAPWPVADLKAAIRCLRYNAAVLPCDTARIFVFGQGMGAGMGASLGVSGNHASYAPYLEALGAATHDAEGTELSDALYGSASWCPVGAFGSADAAYEWMMGSYDATGTRAQGTWTELLSHDLAAAYGSYVNDLGLLDEEGAVLRLDSIEDGSYAGGSYYRRMVAQIEAAVRDFFERTGFPYASVPLGSRERYFPGNPSLRSTSVAAEGGDATGEVAGVRQIEATVYDTRESYIASLNGDDRWLTYNAETGDVDVTGLWRFVSACRPPSKDVCAYDLIDRSGLANQVFGTDDQPSLHFDSMVAKLVESERERYAAAEGWKDELVAEWRGDLAELDTLEVSVAERVRMSDPLALLCAKDEDADVGVAPHWRINTGLFQSETTLAGELNLAVALAACEAVDDVAFQAVWEAGYELAEREGDPEDNLISWIVACCPEQEPAEDTSGA